LGPNRLIVEQTVERSRLDASFTDAVAQQLADVVQTLVVGKIIRPAMARPVVVGAPSDSDEADDADQSGTPIETVMDIQPRIEAPADSASNLATTLLENPIHRIFTEQNGVPQLKQPDLQAKNVKDYVNRLVRLYLYYKQQKSVT
jgi:hypothetical protein